MPLLTPNTVFFRPLFACQDFFVKCKYNLFFVCVHISPTFWGLKRVRVGLAESLTDLLTLNETLAKAYILKEEFREWYNQIPDVGEEGNQFFNRIKQGLRKWYRHLHESGLAAFEGVVETIKRWRGPILNYFITRLTNGLSEALNNVIKTIKKRAYGYRNKEYFSLKIYQKVGLI